jgi:hypothetical protein
MDSPWLKTGKPQQNVPIDDVPGINTFGIDTTSFANGIPFWDAPADTLFPANAKFPAWDVVKLAGQILPGLCAVTGGRLKRYDVKKSKGQNFATLTKQGFDPMRFKIVERIWTPQQLYALGLIMPLLEPLFQNTADPASDAVDVYHPALALRRCSSVVIANISLLVPTPGIHGCWQHEIECLEYKPVKKKQNVTTTPTGSASFARGSPNEPLASFNPPNVTLPSGDAAYVGPGGR